MGLPGKDVAMARDAQFERLLHQKRSFIGRMRIMTRGAHAASYRSMHECSGEGRCFVAGKAEAGHFRRQEPGLLRCMSVMASGTSHADGSMDILFGEPARVVASVTKLRLVGGKPLWIRTRVPVRNGPRLDVGMAGRTPAVHGVMRNLVPQQPGVADAALSLLRIAHGSDRHHAEQENN
jgi:hypothetical protein